MFRQFTELARLNATCGVERVGVLCEIEKKFRKIQDYLKRLVLQPEYIYLEF
jgi:hypothetical protein